MSKNFILDDLQEPEYASGASLSFILYQQCLQLILSKTFLLT